MTTSTAIRPIAGLDASEGQVRFIASLLAERNWVEALPATFARRAGEISTAINVVNGTAPSGQSFQEELTAPFVGGKVNQVLNFMEWKPLTKKGASALIDWLGNLPRKAAPAPAPQVTTEVPAGRYAVLNDEGALNDIAFYVVDRPEEGKWAGYTFVSRMESDSEIRVPRNQVQTILAKIAADLPEASRRYGREMRKCGVCNRSLTNKASRDAGIGPDCAQRTGW